MINNRETIYYRGCIKNRHKKNHKKTGEMNILINEYITDGAERMMEIEKFTLMKFATLPSTESLEYKHIN
jgi:hypothetical protein